MMVSLVFLQSTVYFSVILLLHFNIGNPYKKLFKHIFILKYIVNLIENQHNPEKNLWKLKQTGSVYVIQQRPMSRIETKVKIATRMQI